MYRLVVDVEKYPEFLPWCVGARIRQRSEHKMVADVLIGYHMLRERFTSTVILEPERKVTVDYASGPFNHLFNSWEFLPHKSGCRVKFEVAFDFRSKLLQEMMGLIFPRAVDKMVSAFEKRAADLYAPMSRSERKGRSAARTRQTPPR